MSSQFESPENESLKGSSTDGNEQMTTESKRQGFVDSIGSLLAQYHELESESANAARSVDEVVSRVDRMAELLDELKQQETVSRIDGLKEQVESLQETLSKKPDDQSQQKLDDLALRLERLQEKVVEKLEASSTAFVPAVEKLEIRLDQLQSKIEKAAESASQEQVQGLADQLETMQTGMHEKISSAIPEPIDYSSNIETLNEKVEAFSRPENYPGTKRFEDLESRLINMQNSLSASDEESLELIGISRLSGKIEAIQNQLAESARSDDDPTLKRLEDLDNRMAALQKALSKDGEESLELIGISRLSGKIEALQNAFGESKLQSRDDQSLRRFDDLEARITAIQENLNRGSESEESLELIAISRLASKIESVQNSMVEGSSSSDGLPLKDLDDKLNALTNLVEAGLGGEGTAEIHLASTEQLEQLTGKLDSLAGMVQAGGNEGAGEFVAASNEKLDELANKVESLTTAVESREPGEGDELSFLSGEQLEQLVTKVDSLAELVESRGAGDGSGEGSSFSSEQLKSLVSKMESLTEMVESRGAGDGSGEGSSFSSEQLGSLVSKMDALTEIVELRGSGDSSAEGSAFSSEQLESLVLKMDALTEKVESRGSGGEMVVSGEGGVSSEKFDELTEKLNQTDNRIQTLVGSIQPLVAMLQNPSSVDGGEPAGEEDAWEKQKRSILEGYGFDSGAAEAVAAAVGPESVEGSGTAKCELSDAEVKAAEESDDPEIVDLKGSLEEKLRKAEIEISIERAKMHRQRRELEEMQDELERKAAKMKTSTDTNTDDGDGDSGEEQGRWSRFLGKS